MFKTLVSKKYNFQTRNNDLLLMYLNYNE